MSNSSATLFVTCLIDTLKPQIGDAVVNILNHLGVHLEFPESQTCCGQPAFNAGMRYQAKRMAKHTIEVFEKTDGVIIIPSGSCTAMIRHGYPELFQDDEEWYRRAINLARRTFEFTQYIVDVLGYSDIGVSYPARLTYHASCHLNRGLNIDRQPRALLKNIRQATLIEMPAATDCCGFGGVFSVKHPDISTEMLKNKIDNISQTDADVVVTCDTGCLLNIAGGLHRNGKPVKVMHIAEVLNHFDAT